MALKLSGYLFTGPFPLDTTEVRSNQAPVVYAIIEKAGEPWAPSFRVIEIGFSEDSGLRFSSLPKQESWVPGSGTKFSVYLFYAPRSGFSRNDRQRIASELQQAYNPPHGFVDA